MKRQTTQPALINLSSRFYAMLLVLYPVAYREIYGKQMVQVFRDVARDTYCQQGMLGIVLWWCATALDLLVTSIEQRSKETTIMSESITTQPIKGSVLSWFCILGGAFYLAGGVWLLIEGLPTDPTAVQLTHLLRMMWASGTTCGLMVMMIINATGNGSLARAAAWLTGIGLVTTSLDALIAVIVRNPVSAFTESPLPFSNIVQVIPLVGWVVLTVLVLTAKSWDGWSRFAPLAMLLSPFVGLLFGSLVGNRFLAIMIMGLALIALGFAVKTQLDRKRQAVNGLTTEAANLRAV